MATFEFGTPLYKKLAVHVSQQRASHPPKIVHLPPRVLPEGLSENQFEVLNILRAVVREEGAVVAKISTRIIRSISI
jgi:hypothetical protein